MERAAVPPHERRQFTLILDEAQNFLSDALATILSESRKYGLGLVLSHQYLDQLTPSLQSSVLGNAGSIIAFRQSAEDAERLSANFGDSFTPNQFVKLEPFTSFVRPLDEAPFPFRLTVSAPHNANHGYNDSIISKSRDLIYAPRIAVEEKLKRWIHRTASLTMIE